MKLEEVLNDLKEKELQGENIWVAICLKRTNDHEIFDSIMVVDDTPSKILEVISVDLIIREVEDFIMLSNNEDYMVLVD